MISAHEEKGSQYNREDVEVGDSCFLAFCALLVWFGLVWSGLVLALVLVLVLVLG